MWVSWGIDPITDRRPDDSQEAVNPGKVLTTAASRSAS